MKLRPICTPDNILLVPDKRDGELPKILDFGIAKLRTGPAQTMDGQLLGTPAYMSPEQCCSEADIDHRADIYTLGLHDPEEVDQHPLLARRREPHALDARGQLALESPVAEGRTGPGVTLTSAHLARLRAAEADLRRQEGVQPARHLIQRRRAPAARRRPHRRQGKPPAAPAKDALHQRPRV